MKKIAALLCAVFLCLAAVSCRSAEPGKEAGDGTVTAGPASPSVASESPSGAAFAGEWKAEVIAGLYDDEYLYDVEELSLKADGTARYKNFEGRWSFREQEHAVYLDGAIREGSLSVEVQMLLPVLEKDGCTVLLMEDGDEALNKEFYRSGDFVLRHS